MPKFESMKKVKLAVCFICLFALVGAILSFKAQKFGTLSVWQKSGTICPKVITGVAPWDSGPSIEFQNATTVAPVNPCTDCVYNITVKQE